MRICLLAMSGVRVRSKELSELGVTLPGFVNRGKIIASLPSLALLTIAGCTPAEFDIDYIEIEELEDLTDMSQYDLVAISSYTAQIYEAYRVADMLRSEGIPVVIGGLHATAMPQEAKEHADTVVVGEGEKIWPELLNDFKAGKLKPFYDSSEYGLFDFSSCPMPRFDLLDIGKYNRITIQTSRGCPHSCEFCASSKLLSNKYRQKSVNRVMKELDDVIERWNYPFIEFADDNTFVNRKWAREFLLGLCNRKIRWFTETDISVADYDEVLALLQDSGCHQLLIGLESISSKSLKGVDKENWKLSKRDKYLEAIDKIQSRGIPVNGCFIVGLDGDTVDTFEEIKDFVLESKLLETQITVLTPFPGTPLYDRLKREGRLLKDKYWDRCTLFDVNYIPKSMSVSELEAGLAWLFKELYSEQVYLKRKRHYMDIIKKEKTGGHVNA